MTAAAEGSPAWRRREARRNALLQSEAASRACPDQPDLSLRARASASCRSWSSSPIRFWTQHYLTIDRTFTLENYRIALTEPIYRDLLWRSLYISLTVSLFTVILAYPIAYFISFHGGRHKSLWLFLITIPFWTSYLLRVMSWKVILGYNGVAEFRPDGRSASSTSRRPRCSTIPAPSSSRSPMPGRPSPSCRSSCRWKRSTARWSRRPPISATARLRSFLRVTLPLSVPGVISAVLIVMIPTVGDYVTPKLVGGKDGVMIANAIQAQFGKAANWPLGAALSVTTMVIVTADGRRHGADHCALREAGAMRAQAFPVRRLAVGLCVPLRRLPLSAGHLPADLLDQHGGRRRNSRSPASRCKWYARLCRTRRRCSTPPGTA